MLKNTIDNSINSMLTGLLQSVVTSTFHPEKKERCQNHVQEWTEQIINNKMHGFQINMLEISKMRMKTKLLIRICIAGEEELPLSEW